MGDNRYSTTGYPVVSQPPPPANGYYYPYSQGPYYTPPSRLSAGLRLLLIFLIVASCIIFLMFIILLAVVRPRYPQFTVTSLSMTNFNLSRADEVTGIWTARFQVYNPNSKLKIYYNDVESSVWFGNRFLSVTTLRPFFQVKKNSTTVDADFSCINVSLGSDGGKRLADVQSRGSIPFDLKFTADIRFRTSGFNPRSMGLQVRCPNVVVSTSSGKSTGNFTGIPKPCRVYLSRRILSV